MGMQASRTVTPPRTRWVLPPNWGEEKSPPAARWDISLAAGEEALSPGTPSQEAILELLLDDMCRGHLNVAIRHFLMLRESGAAVPALIERSCEQLVDRCDPARLRQIRRQVQAWHRMVSPPAGAH
jgi:hypothetical protein